MHRSTQILKVLESYFKVKRSISIYDLDPGGAQIDIAETLKIIAIPLQPKRSMFQQTAGYD